MDPQQLPSAAHDRPCVTCRRRKVRCDKVQPCSNCERTGQLCSYEDHKASQDSFGPTERATSDTDVHARLEHLEKLMAALLRKDTQQSGSSYNIGDIERPGESSTEPLASQTAGSTILQEGEALLNQTARGKERRQPVDQTGRLVFKDGCSVYYVKDFWAYLVEEVEPDELRNLTCTMSADGPTPAWLTTITMAMPPSTAELGSNYVEPTIEQSNMLLKYFFDCVNPFTRVIHTAHFSRLLNQYRRGAAHFADETRALLFSIYALTINSMSSGTFEANFHAAKSTWLEHFEAAARMALTKSQCCRSNNVYTLFAVLHYLTVLLQQHRYQDSFALLGIVTVVATRMGYHHDPSHSPLSFWVREVRQRAWNHLCCLDALASDCYGIESCMPTNADTAPPMNANDRDWHVSRYATPESVPSAADGFTDMTFVLVHRELADLIRRISLMPANDIRGKEDLIQKTQSKVQDRFLMLIDRSVASQTIVAAFWEDKIASLRLTLRYRQASRSQQPADRATTLIAALELLEAVEYHRKTFTPLNWGWIFDMEVPWLALAVLLTYTDQSTRQMDVDRAQKMLHTFSDRYAAEPLASSPMWQVLATLRDRSILQFNFTATAGAGDMPNQPGDGMVQYDDEWMLDRQDMFGLMPSGGGQMLQDESQDMPWIDAPIDFV